MLSWLIFFFLEFQIFDGPVALYMSGTVLRFFYYIPILSLVLIYIPIQILKRGLIDKYFLLFAVFFAFTLFTSIIFLGKEIQEVIFGAYIFLPLAVGFYLRETLLDKKMYWVYLICFIQVIAGIFLSYFIKFPWVGAEIVSNGHLTEAAKEWTDGDFSRISGFASASYNAAVQIAVLGLYLFLHSTKAFVRAIYLSFIMLGLILTIFKGLLLGFIVAVLLFLMRNKFDARFLLFSFLFLNAVALFVPLIATSYQGLDQDVFFSNPVENFLFGSVIERIGWMWPQSLHYIEMHGSLIFGNGMGGIGTPISYTNFPCICASTDNAYIYIYGNFGLIGVVAFFLILSICGFRSFQRSSGLIGGFTFIFSFLIVVLDITSAPFERAVLELFLGSYLGTITRAELRSGFLGRKSYYYEAQ